MKINSKGVFPALVGIAGIIAIFVVVAGGTWAIVSALQYVAHIPMVQK